MRYRIEKYVDLAVPYVVLLLGMEIVASLIWDLHEYHVFIAYFDYFVVAVFCADLYFKWTRVRSMKVFIRLYWLDIIAVLPFYWVLRAYETIAGVTRVAEEGQKVVHEALLIREMKITQEIEAVRFVAEGEQFWARFFRGFQRIARFIVLRYETAHGHIKRAHILLHHPHLATKHPQTIKKRRAKKK